VNEAAKSCGTNIDNFGPFLFGHPYKIRDCMMEAHRRAFPIIKENLNNNQPVGITLSIMDYQCIEGGEEKRDKARAESVDICLDQVKDDDFLGVQMYTRHTFGPDGIIMPDINSADMLVMGYEYYPESLENVLRYVSPRINCPMIVTENGIGTDDDQQRINYIATALDGLQSCLDDGLDIKGYYYWSFLDNFEWLFGYKPRFGLVDVDRKTLERKEKESLKFYKSIIDNSRKKTG
jgi:beta-glucosidase